MFSFYILSKAMQHNLHNVQQELQFAILVTCKGGNLLLSNTVGGFSQLKIFLFGNNLNNSPMF